MLFYIEVYMHFFDYSFIVFIINYINCKPEKTTKIYAFASFIYNILFIIEDIIVFEKLIKETDTRQTILWFYNITWNLIEALIYILSYNLSFSN